MNASAKRKIVDPQLHFYDHKEALLFLDACDSTTSVKTV